MTAARALTCRGGKLGMNDARETPDTQIVTWEFDDLIMVFELTLWTPHINDFFECIKTRKRPNADIEEGHLSTLLFQIANISHRLGGRRRRVRMRYTFGVGCVISGERIRTADLGIMNRKSSGTHSNPKASQDNDLARTSDAPADRGAAECAAFASVEMWVQACPAPLTDEQRAGILAMVKAAGGSDKG